MEHIYNNLTKLGGSLGKVPQNLKEIVIKLNIFWIVKSIFEIL
jgi:hypothetical protein